MKITTKHGQVEGVQEGHLWTFRGIPYAKAQRFGKPQPYTWEGVLDAAAFGKKAIQVYDQETPWKKKQSREEFDEDCLNLNIYTPDVNGKLPVVIYIHGGAFQDGSNQEREGGSMIRNHNFLYVSVNYRLGVLGYLYLGKLLGEKYQHTGNLGTLDQLTAVEWIYENIAAFGGDPERMTIMGESAGAKSIGVLLMLPKMRTYCKQVCLGSGASQSTRDEDTAHKIACRFMKLAGLTDPHELLTLSPDDILVAQKRLCTGPESTCIFGPVSDGVVIPYNWQDFLDSPDYWQGRAMIGSCRNEMAFCRFTEKDFLVAAPRLAEKLFGTNGEIAKKDFQSLVEEQEIREDVKAQEKLWVKVLSDYMYRTYSQRLALSLSRHGSQVWWYTMEYGNALHCQDQNMAFSGSSVMQMIGDVSREDAEILAEQIYESYAHFFEFGDPNWEGVPLWPLVDFQTPQRMVWDKPLRVEKVPSNDVLNSFPNYVYKL